MKDENVMSEQTRNSPPAPAGTTGPQPPPLALKPLPGETPRAFSAFITYVRLGHASSHQAVADKLAETLNTIKKWASKYDWTDRLQAFNAGLLDQHARDLAALHCRQTADWAGRLGRFREQEWDAAQKLNAAATCFLETFGDEDLRKMTIAQVARTLRISSALGRSALAGAELPQPAQAELSPVQQQLMDAVQRIYGQATPTPSSAQQLDASQPSTLNSQLSPEPSTLNSQLSTLPRTRNPQLSTR